MSVIMHLHRGNMVHLCYCFQKMMLSTDCFTVHADQGHGDLVTEHMVSRLAGSAGVGLFREQWHVVPCTFTQLGKAGSSAEQVLKQELMAKSSVEQNHLCHKPEYGGGQQPKPCRDSGNGAQYWEGSTGKSFKLAILRYAKWTSNIWVHSFRSVSTNLN